MNDIQTNWCARHLNWAAVGIAIVTPFIFWLFLVFMGGLFGFDIDFLIDPERETLSTATLSIFTYGAIIIHASVYTWLLRKKKRSLWFLLFYLPALIPIIPSLIYPWRSGAPTPVAWQFLGFFIVYIGWIFLIFLRNRSQYKGETIPLPTYRDNFYSRVMKFLSRHMFSYFVIPVTIIMLMAATASFIYMRTGTTTYEYPYSEWMEIPGFSFERPVSVYVTELHSAELIIPHAGEETVFGTRKDGIFSRYWNSFDITVFDAGENTSQLTDVLNTETIKATLISDGESFSLPLWYSRYEIPELEFSPCIISGRQAIHSTDYRIETPEITGTYSVYLLKSNGYIWVIEFLDERRTDGHPPDWFELLLETFTVHDE